MGAGIAVMFKQKFRGVEELKEQSESVRINMEEQRILSSFTYQIYCFNTKP